MIATLKKDWAGGIVAALIALLGAWSVGYVSDGKALDLIGGMLPSVRFLCGSAMTATATVLALLLTLISFTDNRNRKVRADHYDRIRSIARLATAGFIAAIILLLIITLPIKEAPEKLYPFFRFFYYFVLIYSCAIGGLLVMIIIKLYDAASTTITIAHPDQNDDSLFVKEDEESSSE